MLTLALRAFSLKLALRAPGREPARDAAAPDGGAEADGQPGGRHLRGRPARSRERLLHPLRPADDVACSGAAARKENYK